MNIYVIYVLHQQQCVIKNNLEKLYLLWVNADSISGALYIVNESKCMISDGILSLTILATGEPVRITAAFGLIKPNSFTEIRYFTSPFPQKFNTEETYIHLALT